MIAFRCREIECRRQVSYVSFKVDQLYQKLSRCCKSDLVELTTL